MDLVRDKTGQPSREQMTLKLKMANVWHCSCDMPMINKKSSFVRPFTSLLSKFTFFMNEDYVTNSWRLLTAYNHWGCSTGKSRTGNRVGIQGAWEKSHIWSPYWIHWGWERRFHLSGCIQVVLAAFAILKKWPGNSFTIFQAVNNIISILFTCRFLAWVTLWNYNVTFTDKIKWTCVTEAAIMKIRQRM